MIDEEIRAIGKKGTPINVRLVKQANGSYKGFLPFKIEGEYVLNSKNIIDKLVLIQWNKDHVSIEIESKEVEISAFLTKDEASLLQALKSNIKQDYFKEEPAFIVGPPGTGKTSVITQILKQAVKRGLRVLLVSPTNLAVENVFEKFNPSEYGLKEGEVVLTIKTENPGIQAMLLNNIKERKAKPLEDELEVYKYAREELLLQKRDAQPLLQHTKAEKESISTICNNFKNDIQKKEQHLKDLFAKNSSIELRIAALSGNVVLRTVAHMFTDKKVDELKEELVCTKKSISMLENEIKILESKLFTAENSSASATERMKQATAQINEADTAMAQIDENIKRIQKEIEDVMFNNLFGTAKIVGATLTNAALNQKIQQGDFDMLIVDEASMALIPQLIVASQSLNNTKIKPQLIVPSKELYDAQNDAVELALRSKIVFVGDPRQLQPIAATKEMKQSIFSQYNVEDVFAGIAVDRTVFLNINFRNHPHITGLASRLFYGGMLQSGKEEDGLNSVYVRKSASKMVGVGSSFINHGNMKVVYEQVVRALGRGRRSIGVITPYKKQAELINDSFASLRIQYPDADLQAGTINTFQGKEKEIIIYDITYSPLASDSKVPVSYEGDIVSNTAKLLNVAMTRGKSFFVVVGDVEGILNLESSSLVLKQWLEEILKIK